MSTTIAEKEIEVLRILKRIFSIPCLFLREDRRREEEEKEESGQAVPHWQQQCSPWTGSSGTVCPGRQEGCCGSRGPSAGGAAGSQAG